MSWNYAELSKLAKKNGGPENLVDILINSGKKSMFPVVGIAFLFGGGVFFSIQKLKEYLLSKKDSDVELENAKDEIIKGINDYDATQEK